MSLIDNLLNPLERLITEHGSAAILREHIALIKTQLAQYEAGQIELLAKNERLEAELRNAEDRARKAESALKKLQAGQHSGICCDSCGSTNVRRTGSRPDPMFHDVGIKQGLFTCGECGHVSAYTIDPSRS